LTDEETIMADTPPMLLVVHTDVDPAHEAAFNTWYDEDHVPALVRQPGFVRARRYVCVEGQDQNPKYLAVYEFERAEDRKTAAYAEARGFKAFTPHVSHTTIGVFRKIFEYEKPKAP
jgi:antibiotic biosynthesis monooxygenase (ABM) superfamily enzyme